MKTRKQYSTYLWIICIIASVIGIGIQCFYTISMNLWVDEVFSLRMLEHSYIGMIQLTAIDVHPPLYYLILKLCTSLICGINNNINVVYVAKLVSIIPYFLMLFIGITKVRRQWGKYVSGLFVISLIVMPQLINYGVEIRMYSWGMFFVTMSYLTAYDLFLDMKKKKTWLSFTIFSLMAAYTHYFACVSVAVIYLALLVWILLKNRKAISYWFVAVVGTILGYLPWAFSLQCLKKHDLSMESFFAVTGGAVVAGTVAIGIIASVILRPVFVIRYAVPGLMCLGVVVAGNQLKYRIIKVSIVIGVMIFYCYSVDAFVSLENWGKENHVNMMEFVDMLDEDAYVIANEEHIQQVFTAYIENTCYLWKDDFSDLTGKVYQEHVSAMKKVSDIEEKLREGKKVYFLDGINIIVTEAIEEAFYNTNIQYKHVGKYHIECDCDIYELTLEENDL